MSADPSTTRTLTVTFTLPDDYLTTAALERTRVGLELYAKGLAFCQGATVTIDEPPSEVSFDPCITGKVEVGGEVSEFMLPLDNDSARYSQWGASNTVLWPRTDLMYALAEAGREWWLDNRPATDEDNEGEEA